MAKERSAWWHVQKRENEWLLLCGHLRCRGGAVGRGCCRFATVHSKTQRPWASKRSCTTRRWLFSSPGAVQRPHDRFGEEAFEHLFFFFFWVLLDLLNFTGGLSPGRSQIDCCLVPGSYLYTEVLLPVTMFQTRSDLPPSNFRSMWRHHSIRILFCSLVSWWGTQRAQRFHTPTW